MEEPEVAPQEELHGAAGLQEVDANIVEVAQPHAQEEEAHPEEPEGEQPVEAHPRDEEILRVNGQVLTQEPGTLVRAYKGGEITAGKLRGT